MENYMIAVITLIVLKILIIFETRLVALITLTVQTN